MSKSNIEILLGEWGTWRRNENRGAIRSLGYPTSSAFQNMRVDGVRRSDPDVLMVDDDLMRLDVAVAALFPEAMKVVVAHYAWPGPVKVKLDRLGVSRTGYYDMLDCAHKQLSHWMEQDILQKNFVRTPCNTVRTESQCFT